MVGKYQKTRPFLDRNLFQIFVLGLYFDVLRDKTGPCAACLRNCPVVPALSVVLSHPKYDYAILPGYRCNGRELVKDGHVSTSANPQSKPFV